MTNCSSPGQVLYTANCAITMPTELVCPPGSWQQARGAKQFLSPFPTFRFPIFFLGLRVLGFGFWVLGLGSKEGVRVYVLGFFQKSENERSEKGGGELP
jgi:hypothetical protein